MNPSIESNYAHLTGSRNGAAAGDEQSRGHHIRHQSVGQSHVAQGIRYIQRILPIITIIANGRYKIVRIDQILIYSL